MQRGSWASRASPRRGTTIRPLPSRVRRATKQEPRATHSPTARLSLRNVWTVSAPTSCGAGESAGPVQSSMEPDGPGHFCLRRVSLAHGRASKRRTACSEATGAAEQTRRRACRGRAGLSTVAPAAPRELVNPCRGVGEHQVGGERVAPGGVLVDHQHVPACLGKTGGKGRTRASRADDHGVIGAHHGRRRSCACR